MVKFGACFAHRVKAARRKPDPTGHLHDVFVMLRGEPYLLWRAVDQHGVELDIQLQRLRDTRDANTWKRPRDVAHLQGVTAIDNRQACVLSWLIIE